MKSYHRKLLERVFESIDESCKSAITRGEERGLALACRPGCGICCSQAIPLTPLEFMALMEAALELPARTRKVIAASWESNLQLSAQERSCPFLLNASCSVYAARPIACRRYLVAGAPCVPGEDPTITRPKSMLIPARSSLEKAILEIYPWHAANWKIFGLPEPGASPDRAGKLAYLKNITMTIQEVDWRKFLN